LVWQIKLTATAAKQLGKLDQVTAKRIISFLKLRLAEQEDPRVSGKALTGKSLGMYWRYRVGDYRIICDIQDGDICILVIEVGHRKDIYQ
jgi:mRNA interferase RelE/StbE